MGFIFGGGPKAPDNSKQEARIEEDRKKAEEEKTALAGDRLAKSRRKRRGQNALLFQSLEGVADGLSKTLG